MIVIQFLQNLLHYSFAEQHGLCPYTEFLAILSDCSHLAVIQIYDLSMATHKRLLLFLEIFRIDRHRYPFLLSHREYI